MQRSIKSSFMLTFLSTTFFSSLIVSVIFILITRFDFSNLFDEYNYEVTQESFDYFEKDLIDQTRLLRSQISDIFKNKDINEARLLLSYYLKNSSLQVQLYDEQRHLVVGFAKPDTPFLQELNAEIQSMPLPNYPVVVSARKEQQLLYAVTALSADSTYLLAVQRDMTVIRDLALNIHEDMMVIAEHRVRRYIGFGALIIIVLLLISGSISWYATTRFIQALKVLQAHAEQLGTSDIVFSKRIKGNNEIGELARSIYAMAADFEVQNKSVKYLAFHDTLTGIANRSSFQRELEGQIVSAVDHQEKFALFFIDLDDFKDINDNCGHELGDKGLKDLASRLNDGILSYPLDSKKPPLVARFGGDEFTVIVPNYKDREELDALANYVLHIISKPIVLDSDLYYLTASMGISIYPDHGHSKDTLLNAADTAMYVSKLTQKGGYEFFKTRMLDEVKDPRELKSNFKDALEREGELELLYQPIVSLSTGKIQGGEALIRWHHPRLGTLLAGKFIPVIENNEIALTADLWVIETTLKMLDSMDLRECPNFALSANVSASNLGRPQFSESVAKLLEKSPVNPKHLQLEITETYLYKDEKRALESLKALKKLGIKIWLDDFCTGFSSLRHLHVFPVNGIKIDRQFVMTLNKSNQDRLLVSSIVSLANAYNIGAVAEGIEKETDRELLVELDCELGQGNYFSEPLHRADFIEYFETDGERDTSLLIDRSKA